MDYLLLIIGLLAGVVIGYLIARVTANSSTESGDELQVENASLKSRDAILSNEVMTLKEELNKVRLNYENELKTSTEWKGKYEAIDSKLEEQKNELEELQTKFTKEFELVANKILEEKSSKFTEQNKENLDVILTPLKERIKEFQQKVETNNENSVKRTTALEEQLKMLKDLNQEITQETKSLTQALRGDSKAQGNWGEMHLESILDKAGLQKDTHYTKETNLKTEDGSNQRLDYIINLPDGKKLILDSKVSLTAYSKYFDAETDKEKGIYLKQHIDSVNTHVKLLGGKDYQKLHDINTPDYVLMFIANEPALTLALKEDQTLFEKALDKNIVIVSTSTLLATLRTISYIWKQDLQNKNAEEIARQAGNLYDKFVGFTDDLIRLGDQMKTASKTYDAAMNKMVEGSGNITKRIQDLKKLGVNPSKNIDQRLIDRSKED
jgi:DNA recombination protein RmuC